MRARLYTAAAIAALMTTLWPRTSLAQEPPDVEALTLEAAIARAIAQEPGLRAARADAGAARGMLAQAQLKPNPMLSATYQREPAGMDRQTSVMLEWPLDLFRRDGRTNVAEREIDAADARARDRERMLAADVRMAYGAAVAAARQLALVDDVIAAAARELTIVSARVEGGSAPRIERDVLMVDTRRLDAERLTQAADADRALIELKRLLGMTPETPLRLSDTLETMAMSGAAPAPRPDVDARADVVEAGANLRAAEARIDRAHRDGKFDMSLFGGYMRMDAGFPQFGMTATGDLTPIRGVFHNVLAGASVMLPLRNRQQGEQAAARAQRDAAQATLAAAELRARSEVAAAAAADARAQAAVAVFSAEVRTLARQNLDVVRQTYELGRATAMDLVTEQRRYLELERAYADTLMRAFAARAALQRATGEQR